MNVLVPKLMFGVERMVDVTLSRALSSPRQVKTMSAVEIASGIVVATFTVGMFRDSAWVVAREVVRLYSVREA